MINVPELTKEEYDLAVARAENSLCAVAFAYDEKTQMIRLNLNNNTSVIFPLSMLPALICATPAQIRNVRFVSDGMDIWWDDLDVQHTVEYIVGKATGTIVPRQNNAGVITSSKKPKAAAKRGSGKTGIKKISKTPAQKSVTQRKKIAA